jgi:uncharacterized membrane protein
MFWKSSLLLFSFLLAACGSSAPPTPESDGGSPDAGLEPFICEVTAPTECPTPAPVYADIAPIIQQRCAVCHGATPEGPWPLNDYHSVADWQDDIRGDILNCSMPPSDAGLQMTREEREKILAWIRCGTPQ